MPRKPWSCGVCKVQQPPKLTPFLGGKCKTCVVKAHTAAQKKLLEPIITEEKARRFKEGDKDAIRKLAVLRARITAATGHLGVHLNQGVFTNLRGSEKLSDHYLALIGPQTDVHKNEFTIKPTEASLFVCVPDPELHKSRSGSANSVICDLCCQGLGCLAVLDDAEQVKQHMKEAKADADRQWGTDRHYKETDVPLARQKWRVAFKAKDTCPCGLARPYGRIDRAGSCKRRKSDFFTAVDCPNCAWPRHLLRLTTNSELDARITDLMEWLPASDALKKVFSSCSGLPGKLRSALVQAKLIYHVGSQYDVACYVAYNIAKANHA